MTNHVSASHRREFLRTMGIGMAGLALSRTALRGAVGRPLRGLFPIAYTPGTADGKMDLDAMVAQVKFCNRGGVHGLMWPQNASGWTNLSDSERMEGNEVTLSAAKGGKTAIVIGVQSADPAAVSRYAKQAEKLGADAIISLPPPGATDDKVILSYFQEVGKMTSLPLFAQAVGPVSVDLLVEMVKTIPTMRYVKDEAGVPLDRIADLRQKTGDQLKVFSGAGAGTMMTEMERGFSGACPYTCLADVFASSFDLWHAGKKRAAYDMFGRIQAFATITPISSLDILIARGVFKPGTKNRATTGAGATGGGGRGGRSAARPLSIEEIRTSLDVYLKPYLKA